MVKILNMTKSRFQKYIENKKVVFLCAGNMLHDFISEYQGIQYDPVYVLDNNKNGSVITIHGKSVPIKAFGEAGTDIKNSVIILTSEKYSAEIILQLDQVELFDDMSLIIPGLLEPEYSLFEFDKCREHIIPKIIHYCWFGKNRMSEECLANIESWKKYCPDYEIKRWDESNYDVAKCKYMKQAYDAQKWGFVSDYARLDVVYSYGGIYLDLDVEMLRPWDDLLGYDLFCGFESNEAVAFGLGFGAKRHHHIIKKIMDLYEKMDFQMGVHSDYLIPCPVYQTRVLKEEGLICDGESREYKDFLALSPIYFSPINGAGIGRTRKESYSIHKYAASWFDKDALEEKNKVKKKYSFIYDHMVYYDDL